LAQLILKVKKKQDQLGQLDDEASPTPTPQASLPKVCVPVVVFLGMCFSLFFIHYFTTLRLLLFSGVDAEPLTLSAL